MIMKDRIEAIFTKFDEFRTQACKNAMKNNKVAGRRARVVSIEIEKMLKEYRAAGVAHDKQ